MSKTVLNFAFPVLDTEVYHWNTKYFNLCIFENP